MITAYERTAESRARILAPIGRIEVFETIRAQGEPPDTPDLFFIIHTQADGTNEKPLGTAGNLAGALQLCALKVAEQLAQAEAQQTTTRPEPGADPALAHLLRNLDTRKFH